MRKRLWNLRAMRAISLLDFGMAAVRAVLAVCAVHAVCSSPGSAIVENTLFSCSLSISKACFNNNDCSKCASQLHFQSMNVMR